MQSNQVFVFRTEIGTVRAPACFRSFFQCPLRRKMELIETCCFEFDRKRRPGSKVSFLRNIHFYFRVAGFTPLSPLPEVGKNV